MTTSAATLPVSDTRTAQVETLGRLNAEAIIDAFGLSTLGPARSPLEWLVRLTTRGFAEQLADFDLLVGTDGLQVGSAWLLEQMVESLSVAGLEHIPASGPVVIVSNHPGLSDTLALMSSIARPDLKIVAADRPFLRALFRTSARLLYLAPRPEQRLGALRGITGHLREGGALLTFAAGHIEPDPAIQPEAARRLEHWSDHLGLLMRLCQNVAVVPAMVSGVLSPAAQRNPITRIRRLPSDREWLGATLQMLVPAYRQVRVHVAFGPPITGALLDGDPGNAVDALRAGARALIPE